MSFLWIARSFTRPRCVINTTLYKKYLFQMVLHRSVGLARISGNWLFAFAASIPASNMPFN
jgi:hypothetical protein